MSNRVVELRISRDQAAFLQANLNRMATTTRQAMMQPGLPPERHTALGRRALVLESADDAVRSAMLELPNSTRKSARGVESTGRGTRHEVASFTCEDREPERARRTPATFDPVTVARAQPKREAPASDLWNATTIAPPVNQARSSPGQRPRSNAWLDAFLKGYESSPK